MRVAVVGAGTMGGMHAQLLAGMDGVDEVLVVDADAGRAASVAAAIGGRSLRLDAALEEADAIVVATPAEAHADVVTEAIRRGRHVLCEKPLTDSLASSIEVTRLAETHGAHVELGFQRRHDPGYAAARRAVAEGRTGPIRLLRLTAFDPMSVEVPAEAWPPSEIAPLFLHSSIHDFDFARWITGEEVVDVTADGSARRDPRPADPRGLETVIVTMRTSGGTLAVLEGTWLHPSGYDNRVEIVAQHGHHSVGLTARSPVLHLEWPAVEAADPWVHYLGRFEAAYRAELEAFLATCRGERPASSSARDGLEAMRIAVAATRAYSERRSVGLDEIPGIEGAEVA